MTDTLQTERKVVKTRIPAYQKEEWESHASELDMTLSEFIRCTVQAGRRSLRSDGEKPPSRQVTPGGKDLKAQVQHILVNNDPRTFDEIVGQLTEEIRSEAKLAIRELESENRITQSVTGEWICQQGDQNLNGE